MKSIRTIVRKSAIFQGITPNAKLIFDVELVEVK